jgi:uncharacterized membrane protein
MLHSYLIDIVLMLLGIAGFWLASYIYHCKHKQKPLVCPLRTSCDFVTGSDYSKFLGIPVERLGMVYYLSMFMLHVAVIINPLFFTRTVLFSSLIASTLAILFSIYLISVQAFVLKQWCTWCVCSAILCAAIFAITFLSTSAVIF